MRERKSTSMVPLSVSCVLENLANSVPGTVPPAAGGFPYNNYSYPPMGYSQANGVQLGLVTEHMLRVGFFTFAL